MSQGSIKSSRRLSRLKTSRDDSKVSTITEESAAALNFRATLTEEFFQSIYHTLLVNEKLSLKTLSEGETPSTRSLDTTESLSDSNNSRKLCCMRENLKYKTKCRKFLQSELRLKLSLFVANHVQERQHLRGSNERVFNGGKWHLLLD